MARKAQTGAGKKGAKALPPGMTRALADRKASADSEALLSDLIEVWGGTRQLAIDIHAEFQSAGKGGMTRQRILEMFQRLIITNTTHEIGQTTRPSDLSDEDLEAVALQYANRVTGNGTATAAAAGSEEGTG